MKKKINNKLIRLFDPAPCYDPKELGIPESESLTIKKWIEKYRDIVKKKEDVIWLVCRPEFMSDRNCRLFAVWCARQSYQYYTSEYPIDQRSIDAVDCAERFANGLATNNELSAARSAAWLAAKSAAWSAAWSTARSAAESAAWSAAWLAAGSATGSAAGSAAESAAWSAAESAAESAARSAAWSAAASAAWSAAASAAGSAQIDHLLTYFP